MNFFFQIGIFTMTFIVIILVLMIAHWQGKESRKVSPRLLLVNSNPSYFFLASLKYRQNYSHFCFASLIRSKYALTAAHCLLNKDPKDVIVTFQERLNSQFTLNSSVSQLILHENFTSRYAYNDIALIRIDSPMTSIQPIELDLSNQSVELNYLNGIIWNNWARKLASIRVKVLSSEDRLCRKYSIGSNYSASLYCAYGRPNVCLGDSGSPLFKTDANKLSLVGIASGVLTYLDPKDRVIKCFFDAPSYFTRINLFSMWLQANMMN